MLVLNNTPFVHARVYLQYLNSALPGLSIRDSGVKVEKFLSYKWLPMSSPSTS
jgi:hypothetical protein